MVLSGLAFGACLEAFIHIYPWDWAVVCDAMTSIYHYNRIISDGGVWSLVANITKIQCHPDSYSVPT